LRFVKNIREYRVFRKYVKLVKQDITYLVVPESTLPEILLTVKKRHATSHTERKSEIFIEIQGFTDTEGYEEWKAEVAHRCGKGKSNIWKLKLMNLKNKYNDLRELIWKNTLRNFKKHFQKIQKLSIQSISL